MRPLLPGLYYQLPPMQEGKRSPASVTLDEAAELFAAAAPCDPFTLLQPRFFGLCPLVCREIAARAGDGVPSLLAAALLDTVRHYAEGDFAPAIVEDPARHTRDFTVIKVESMPVTERFEAPSAMLDAVFAGREDAEKLASRASALLRPDKAARQR